MSRTLTSRIAMCLIEQSHTQPLHQPKHITLPSLQSRISYSQGSPTPRRCGKSTRNSFWSGNRSLKFNGLTMPKPHHSGHRSPKGNAGNIPKTYRPGNRSPGNSSKAALSTRTGVTETRAAAQSADFSSMWLKNYVRRRGRLYSSH